MKNPTISPAGGNPNHSCPLATPPAAVAPRTRTLRAVAAMLLPLLAMSNVAHAAAAVSVYSLPSSWTTAPGSGNVGLTASGGGAFTIPAGGIDGMLVVTISGELGQEPTSVTWGNPAVTMTRANSTIVGTGNGAGYSGIFYLVNPPSGTGPLSLNGYSGNRFCAYAVYATGVNPILPPALPASAVGGSNPGPSPVDTITPASITPSAGSLVVTVYGASPTTVPSGSFVASVSAKIVRAADNTEPFQTTPPRAGDVTSAAAAGHMIAADASPLKGRTTHNLQPGNHSVTIASFAPSGPKVFEKLLVETPASSVTVGTAFNVTITAQDAGDPPATVVDSTTIVSMSSASSLMEFDWNSDGIYGDNGGTLVAGVKTIKARNNRAETTTISANGGGGMPIPDSIETTADSYTKLQILAPGETAAPGTLTGKTGTPSTRTYTVPFTVIVNAVDQYWNRIITVNDTVALTSTDPAATLPFEEALLDGSWTFDTVVALNTPVGNFTVTATNVTDGTKTASTTPVLPLQTSFSWQGDGAANLWNTSAANWIDFASTPVAFVNGVIAVFPESASNRTVDLVGTLTPAAITVSNSTGNYTFGSMSGGLISGSTGLTKSGAGTLTLSTANTYTGTTSIGGGIVSANAIADSAGSAIGFGSLTLSGGVLSYTGTGLATTARTITIPAVSSPTIEVSDANGILNLGGAIGSAASSTLIKSGPGTLILSGSADNNNLVVNATAGEIQLAKASSGSVRAVAGISGIANGATVKLMNSGTGTDQIFGGTNTPAYGVNGIAAGGTLNLNGYSEGVSFLNGTGGVVEGGSFGSLTPTLTVGQSDVSSTFSGILQNATGTLSLVKTGTGTLTLNAANTHTGTTTVSGGIINLGNNLALQNSALATAGGVPTKLVLIVGSTSPTFGGLSGASGDLNSTLITGYGGLTALTLNPTSGIVTYGGAITEGAVGMTLTKTGAGTQVLSGNNTYTGPTAVNVGTLALVGGSQKSEITVAGGASLGFTLGSPTTSTAAVNLTAGAVTITGTVDNVSDYLLMTAASFTGPFNLAAAISGYQLETRASGTQLWLARNGDPYTVWAGPGVNFDDDANSDGVDNGLAWLLGAANKDDSALGLLPVTSQTGGNLKLNFKMLPTAARGTAQLFLEYGGDLAVWSVGVLVPEVTGGAAPATFVVVDTDLGNPNNPLDVEATVSASEAAAGKLFSRLTAVK